MGHATYTWSKQRTTALVASLDRLGCTVTVDTDVAGGALPDAMEALIIESGKQTIVLTTCRTAPHMRARIPSDYFAVLFTSAASRGLCDLVETLLLASGAKASRRPIASQKLYRSPAPDWSNVAGALARSSLSLEWLEVLPTGLRSGTITSSKSASITKKLSVRAGPMVDPVDSSEQWFVALRYRQGLLSLKSVLRDKVIADVDAVFRQTGMSFIDTRQA